MKKSIDFAYNKLYHVISRMICKKEKGVENMMNMNKLRGKIAEKGLTIPILAEEIGIDKSTIYRKIKANGEKFTIKEANLICSVLDLDKKEANEIFFNNNVAFHANKGEEVNVKYNKNKK